MDFLLLELGGMFVVCKASSLWCFCHGDPQTRWVEGDLSS